MFKKGFTPWNKGKKRPPFSKEWKEKMRLSHIGKSSGMLGKKHKPETILKMSKWRPNKKQLKKMTHKNENHPRWKGNQAGRAAIHIWLRSHYKKKGKCDFCNKKFERTQFAKKTEANYTRKREDYYELCPKCHAKYDDHLRKKSGRRL